MKHPKEVNKLISALQRLIRALKDEQMSNWEEHFKQSLATLQRGHYRSAKRHVLQVYGGMGSFNDVAGFDPDDPVSRYASEVRMLVDEIA